MLNAHCRQQGPSRIPEHFNVAGFCPQIEQWYIPGWLSITSNVTGDFGTLPSQFFSSLRQLWAEISDRGHRSLRTEKAPAARAGVSGDLTFRSRCGCYELLCHDRLVHIAKLQDDRCGEERLIDRLHFGEMVPVELLCVALLVPE